MDNQLYIYRRHFLTQGRGRAGPYFRSNLIPDTPAVREIFLFFSLELREMKETVGPVKLWVPAELVWTWWEG